MKIGNQELKLFYSNLAAREINELCGGIKNMSTLLTGKDGEELELTEQFSNITKLIRILLNANITKENCEISLGMRDGEKKEKFSDETLETLLDLSKIREYITEVLECMGLASQFEVPDGIKLESPDLDLEELEAEQNP